MRSHTVLSGAGKTPPAFHVPDGAISLLREGRI
jgi:hypothetical protein